MNKLYLLGGSTRTGKSTIMMELLKRRPVHLVASDALVEGVRKLFIEDPFQITKSIHLEGHAEYVKRGSKDRINAKFFKTETENSLAKECLMGMLDHYQRNQLDVAVEGYFISPEWVDSLEVDGYEIIAAFVGFLDPIYGDSILKYAKSNEHDWMNEWLEHHNNDDSKFRTWIKNNISNNMELAKEAEELGFRFFDASESDFDTYVNSVVEYLLHN